MHVAFESEHSSFTLPTTGLTRRPEISLHTFFVWTQRLGFFPSLEPSLEDALAKGDLAVIANPDTAFEQEELDSILTYVNRGGRLLVLIDSLNLGYPPRQLLGALGIRLESPEEEVEGTMESEQEAAAEEEWPIIVSAEGDLISLAARPVGLVGGNPVLKLSDGRTVLTESGIGKGKVFVFSDFYLFTEDNMGHTGETRDARRRMVSELEYWMLREIMDLPQPTPY